VTGHFLHGDTDHILSLSNKTIAHAEDINNNSVTLGNHNAQLAGQSWNGTAHVAFASVEDTRLADNQKLTNMLQMQGDNTRTVGNLYDTVDSDGHHTVGSVSYGIGPIINV